VEIRQKKRSMEMHEGWQMDRDRRGGNGRRARREIGDQLPIISLDCIGVEKEPETIDNFHFFGPRGTVPEGLRQCHFSHVWCVD